MISHNNDFYLLPKKTGVQKFIAATTLSLVYPTRHFGDIKISIDIVPVVKFPLSSWRPKGLNNSLILQSEDRLCASLMKPAKFQKHALLLLPKNDQLRISTSLVERQIIQQMPSKIKDAFIALKALRDFMPDSLSFNTYIIKNAVIRYASNPDISHSIAEENVLNVMIDIVSQINTVSYFFPGMKIFGEDVITFNDNPKFEDQKHSLIQILRKIEMRYQE